MISSRRDHLDLEAHVAQVGELHGVAQQIDQHLPQADRVGRHHGRQRGVLVPDEIEFLLMGPHRDRPERVVDDRREVERHLLELDAAGLDPRQVHDVVDDRDERFRRPADCLQVLSLRGRETRVEGEFRHAEHTVHRRPDLVTHRRHELALEEVRALGAVLGRLEFGGALIDFLLELVVMSLELAIACRQVREHAVERTYQDADLVDRRAVGQPHVEALRAHHFVGGEDELPQRRDHRSLEGGTEHIRHAERDHERGEQDGEGVAPPRLDASQIRLDKNGADAAVGEADVSHDANRLVALNDAHGGRGRGRRRPSGSRLLREETAVLPIQRRHTQVGAWPERLECLLGEPGVLEREGRCAVLADNDRDRVDFLHQRGARRGAVVEHEAHARQGQRGRDGGNEHEGQLTAEGVTEHVARGGPPPPIGDRRAGIEGSD